MVIAYKITLMAAGMLYTLAGLGDGDDDKDCKAANVTGALGMFILLWLTLMTM